MKQSYYAGRFLWRLARERLRRLCLFILRRRFFFKLPIYLYLQSFGFQKVQASLTNDTASKAFFRKGFRNVYNACILLRRSRATLSF